LGTAYGDAVLSSAQVPNWHKAIKDGRENVEDKQRAGRSSTSKTESNVAHVKAVLDRDRLLSVRLMAGDVGLLKTDVHRIITKDLCMKKVHTRGSFTTTMRQVTHHSLCGNFWFNIISQRFSTQCTTLTWLHAFFLFPKLKSHLKKTHFGTVENVEAAATRALNNISSEDFLHCYEEW
jgi:hypothetical protein